MQKRSCIAVQLGVVLLLMQPPSTHAQEVGPTIGGCPVFPSDNIWNRRIDRLPVDPRSKKYVATIGATEALRADFGSGLHDGAPIGIPFATRVAWLGPMEASAPSQEVERLTGNARR